MDRWIGVAMQGTQVRIAEHELDAILREVFGDRRHGVTATVIGEGMINDTRRLSLPDGTQRYLRLAPTDEFVANGPSWFTAYGLRREAAVIAAASDLAAYLPVTVAYDFDRTIVDRDWVIQQAMPGDSLRVMELGRETTEREDIWMQVGRFTRSLHQVVGSHFGPPAWGPAFERWSDLLMWDAAGLVEDAHRYGIDRTPFERLAAMVTGHRELLDQVVVPRLIHSDLCRGHIFAQANGPDLVLTGVIDLEFGRFADPLSEALITGFAWGNGPVEMESTFMRAYAPDGFTVEDRHRIRIYAALALAWFAPLLAMTGEPLDDLLRRLGEALDRLDARM
jgi:aminoglycoside phosphotransferase (APT) family kinase protein